MIKRIGEKKDSNIKKIMKKNQVVILAISLMLMTAGYLNYTNNHENENLLLAQLGDAQLVSTNVADENSIIQNEMLEENNLQEENPNTVQGENVIENANVTTQIENVIAENSVTENTVNESNTVENEVVETSNESVESDYFTKSKLERETMYSQMLETYQGILENEKIPSDQKDIAENEIKNINDKKNAIMIAENLLQTKGFKNVVIFINDPSVNVILDNNNLETQQIAQIQNIVQRELNVEIENIHIGEVG